MFYFRLEVFRKSLLKMFQQKRSDTLPVDNIRDYINSQTSPSFSSDEIQAALNKMSDDNKIMVADNNIFLI
jgi:DNA replication licensing factor MCM3